MTGTAVFEDLADFPVGSLSATIGAPTNITCEQESLVFTITNGNDSMEIESCVLANLLKGDYVLKLGSTTSGLGDVILTKKD